MRCLGIHQAASGRVAMSGAARDGLVLGLIVLAVAMLLIVSADQGVPGAADEINDPLEATYWQQQIQNAARDFGLEATRASAGKWGASAAAILGVLATVAVVQGPSDLAKDVG